MQKAVDKKIKKKTQKVQKLGPIVLIILDGWGVAPKGKGNAIYLANTPMMDYFMHNYPNTILKASGKEVGLPNTNPGNSETGHMNIGAGRVVKQDILDINEQIVNGKFFNNHALKEVLEVLKKRKNANIHLIGLLTGTQSSHTYPEHLYATLDFFKMNKVHDKVFLHLITDGRDSGKHDGAILVQKLIRNFENNEVISSVIGRFYGMDRADNWERTQIAYDLFTLGRSEYITTSPLRAFTNAYNRNESDEYIEPTVINNEIKKSQFVKNGDIIIFYNARSDRSRQLVKPFVLKNFEKEGGFKREKVLKNLHVVTFTDFAGDLDSIHNAFASELLENTLPCALSENGISQAYFAEKEKFAHMTYFINGGVANTRCGEKRYIFDSSHVRNFINTPKMATPKITDKMIEFIKKSKFDFYAANFSNADMLGHTGDIKATIKGVECIDRELKKLYKEVIKRNGVMFITADHGNAEVMLDENGDLETQHNPNPVPFIIIDQKLKGKKLKFKNNGKLANVVPTIFNFIGLNAPKEMTLSLINNKSGKRNIKK